MFAFTNVWTGQFNINNTQLKELNSYWNSVFIKIFGYNKWESVKEVICRLGRLDFLHLINMRRILLLKSMHFCNNSVILELLKNSCCISEILKVQNVYKIQMVWSVAKIKALTHISFNTICGVWFYLDIGHQWQLVLAICVHLVCFFCACCES